MPAWTFIIRVGHTYPFPMVLPAIAYSLVSHFPAFSTAAEQPVVSCTRTLLQYVETKSPAKLRHFFYINKKEGQKNYLLVFSGYKSLISLVIVVDPDFGHLARRFVNYFHFLFGKFQMCTFDTLWKMSSITIILWLG